MKAGNAIKGFLKKGSLQASKMLGMNGLKLKEKSPEILMVVGVVTGGAAIVSAVFAGRKLDMLVADHEERVEAAKAEVVVDPECIDQNGEFLPDVDVEKAYITRTKKEINRAVRHEYGVTLIRSLKLFALPGGLFAISMGSFVAVKNIQGGMINALTGAYTSLQEYCRAYEQRNIELNGEESHRMCKYGYKEVEVEEEDPDNGETYKVKKKVPLEASEIAAQNVYHDHFITFSRQTSPIYKGRKMYDLPTLEAAENYIEDLVYSRGWAVLNDVYDALGMTRNNKEDGPVENPEAMIEGWVKGCGPRVDLGIHDAINNRFLAGYLNETVILSPNIHGNVYAILKKQEEEKLANKMGMRPQAKESSDMPFTEDMNLRRDA